MAGRAMHRPCQFIRARPFIRPAGGRNSIKEGRCLVAGCVSAMVDARGASLNRQRNHGGNEVTVASVKTMAIAVMKVFMAGLRWYLTNAASNNVNLGGRTEIQREATHIHRDSCSEIL
jgi:hypothetical protein